MRIHVFERGQSLQEIAAQYNVSVTRLLYDNALMNAEQVTEGQALLILEPEVVHLIQPGDTLSILAEEYNTSVRQLLRNNPFLIPQRYLRAGEYIVIRYQDEPQRTARVNGYAYPYINTTTLEAALPYLTELSIFSYGFTNEGELVPPERSEDPLLEMASRYEVRPILVLTPRSGEESFNSNLVTVLVNDPAVQERLIQNLFRTVAEKGYAGVDVDFEYILPEDREGYADFVETLTEQMNAQGYTVSVALAPKVSADQPGVLYEGVDYGRLGAAANSVLLMTYEWGYTYGPPMAVAPIPSVRRVVEYGLSEIEPGKIDLGIPNYGYDWPLPYERGVTRARSIGNLSAVDIAASHGVGIQFDETAQSPWFTYEEDGQTHEVWFEDVRSLQAKFDLLKEKELRGAGYWNIMRPFRPNWLLLNANFRIEP